jgi:type II secretory pathway predicted ATPase ExeA
VYEKFYGLRERPFSLMPDPSFLYLGRNHQQVLTLLQYALAHGTGFALVTGEIGSGKTTLVRHLLTLTDATVTVGLISNTHHGFNALLPWVAQCLGVPARGRSEPELYEAFVDHLLREYASGRRTVLILDEAQNLSAHALEELRVLSNINSDKDLLLQTILVGQPELRATLAQPGMAQLAQRIAIEYHLGPLQRSETHDYVRHRLAVAGGSPDLIQPEAVELLHTRTGGVPRLINLVCDMALVYGFSDQKSVVDAELVAQVLKDRAANSLVPLHDPARPSA